MLYSPNLLNLLSRREDKVAHLLILPYDMI